MATPTRPFSLDSLFLCEFLSARDNKIMFAARRLAVRGAVAPALRVAAARAFASSAMTLEQALTSNHLILSELESPAAAAQLDETASESAK